MNAWRTDNFLPTRVFVVSFLVEFTVQIFTNPRSAPIMILGEWAVAGIVQGVNSTAPKPIPNRTPIIKPIGGELFAKSKGSYVMMSDSMGSGKLMNQCVAFHATFKVR
jgi:hypothetical protein